MGSEAPSRVTIHVTGFKKFQGVTHNPTETIASNLKTYVEKRGLRPGVTLGSSTVLEAAGYGALPMFYQVMESGLAGENNSNNEQVVWLHLGVNNALHKFAIEQQAVNEATFLCPDELGWQPQQLPIVFADGEISQTREVLKTVRKEVLKGCKLIFTRVFPAKFPGESHQLWKMAEQLGATCSTEMDASVTHVVSMDKGTEKSRWAVRENKFLVHPGWIEAANYLWRKQAEEKFPVDEVKQTK